MSTRPFDEIVCLVTAPNPAQAHIWAAGLQKAGIRCRVVGDYLDVGIGDIPGVRPEIWVRRSDLTQGEAVLREYVEAGSDETTGPEGEEEK